MATPYSRIVPDLPPWSFEPRGRYDEHLFMSEVLKAVIQGLTGQIDMWRSRPAFRKNFPELADAQFAAGAAKPCVLVYVDCWTSLGGSQYVDSPGTGKYLLNDWCMAACYSTAEDGTVRLPYDTATGQLIPEIWERWLRWDPVRMVPDHAETLRKMRAIYIDAGKRDQYYLDFRRALEAIGVTDIFFELFDATHDAIEYRYPIAIKYLAERLTP